ncbi:hypothetical protein DWQ65_07445 [Treponema phagedenis]|uniref:hypothetical protein n=1 Tax=Treponema phagedenis TaxID=162 RepID=UPI0001F63B22|nr:hypothetical protein [Treponema phagedenis]EFW38675.1 hypothetical protein HMPREF9554_00852 [Treponema phagedenis F0421]QSH99901.1 hypothetical protein DWQ65_07445 [Treponema phagedenis]TYT79733.1 hypothetical protein FS559_11990 [Treponema phagedenis]
MSEKPLEKDKQISFRTSPQFFELVDNLSKELGRPKTQIIEEAVRLFSKTDMANLDYEVQENITEKLNAIIHNQEELRTLIMQVLKNQQD